MKRITLVVPKGCLLVLMFSIIGPVPAIASTPLQMAYFEVDASPPVGSPMAYNVTEEVLIPLSCRGVILIGSQQPIVLCAMDWLGISNDGHREFRETLAAAAGTTPDRVAIHALHQHDAIWCDFSADEIARQYGIVGDVFDSTVARTIMQRAAAAIADSVKQPKPITHLGLGEGLVEQVASNRRLLGSDGKVKHIRYSAERNPALRALPEGVIDPRLKSISLWNEHDRLVVITYYATHPQSYYRTGKANPDFPGIARNQRQQKTGVPHIHFCGAAGNITAGKYNDGAHENRQLLADRLALGMSRAWESEQKSPLSVEDVAWQTVPVALPVSEHLSEQKLLGDLGNSARPKSERSFDAMKLAWLRRCLAGDTIGISCLSLGSSRVLHMPGELFVEYQLAAQHLRPDLFVAMAAFGDYAPCYIGTEISYSQGGYETSTPATQVASSVESVLVNALVQLLQASGPPPNKLGVQEAAREAEYARQNP